MKDKEENYLSVLSVDALLDSTLSEEELYNIQNQLWLLLGWRTERYTMGESSSVPVETAQELLKSICFCIDIYLKHSGKGDIRAVSKTKEINMKQLFLCGISEVEKQISVGKDLLKTAAESTMKIKNIFYQYAVPQAKQFFKEYDYSYFANDIPVRVEYQICQPVEKLEGIEYINEYLKYFTIENKFCGCFDLAVINDLLQAYSFDCKYTPINIYELVAINAIGLTLIEKDSRPLDINKFDSDLIIKQLLSLSKNAAIEKLILSSQKLCTYLDISDVETCEYLRKTAVKIYEKMEALIPTNSFDTLFVYIEKSEEPEIPISKYIDSEPMDDDDLRKLIDNISDCESLSEKIIMVKDEIHSLRDLVEVLNICFWSEECIYLFDSFEYTEIAVLVHFINEKYKKMPLWHSESGWEIQLLNYVDASKK